MQRLSIRHAKPAPSVPGSLGHWLSGLLLMLACGLATSAEPLQIDNLPAGQQGLYSTLLQEGDTPMDLREAMQAAQDGRFRPGPAPVLHFGIGSRPVWVRLALHNPHTEAIQVRVITGITWIDSLQLSLVRDGQLLQEWRAGDNLAGARDLVPGMGFIARLSIPSGDSELYLRAESPDPLVLPIEVLREESFQARHLEYRFVYGLIYGFLLSMIVYNGMLFIGLKDRSYLYYSLYLGLFGVLNIAYTGHGLAWFWEDYRWLQEHCILISMVLTGCAGLAFTSSFLDLARRAPGSRHLLQGMAATSLAGLLLSQLLGNQAAEATIAFSFALVYSASMLFLGLTTLRRNSLAGHYYLAATLCGMLGTVITTLTVWGALPFTGWNYGAIKIGLMLQAALLALALSHRIRQQQYGRLRAERLAERDPLTGLHNRRGFNEQAAPLWNSTVRHQRPLSLIMLDLDHFKTINDLHGHAAGDLALVQTAKLLANSCRGADLLARWGGEEFLLLLPETGLNEARALAERLRAEIQALSGTGELQKLALSASFGVIERSAQLQLEQLINQADRLLYVAKHSGRNRVCAEA
ncbi:diguanylate cyclase [Pseudomonas sp. N040]|uniref:diguanylate cyclase n=1 Tax=Pseudomonas sp. N040 TaxID=2785325 RepID=UPI0018A2D9D8|nr:diguanylate cyclase [Pseudomonas sp. N040]MBF7730082.1 GGDEF domain-containing protein [Pseudomonas sp. N040]MBW7013724.1 sensor domain-containing diguanylate cyclase [Pseudomonas sp. N040]